MNRSSALICADGSGKSAQPQKALAASQNSSNGNLRLCWTDLSTNIAAQTNWTPIFTNTMTSPGVWPYTDTSGVYQQKYWHRILTP